MSKQHHRCARTDISVWGDWWEICNGCTSVPETVTMTDWEPMTCEESVVWTMVTVLSSLWGASFLVEHGSAVSDSFTTATLLSCCERCLDDEVLWLIEPSCDGGPVLVVEYIFSFGRKDKQEGFLEWWVVGTNGPWGCSEASASGWCDTEPSRDL